MTELERLYNEGARLLAHLGALVEEARLRRDVIVCPGCGIPTVVGGRCDCDVQAARAAAKLTGRAA